jgi:hypothetical protein
MRKKVESILRSILTTRNAKFLKLETLLKVNRLSLTNSLYIIVASTSRNAFGQKNSGWLDHNS